MRRVGNFRKIVYVLNKTVKETGKEVQENSVVE
jgi:hypothetical protein